MEPSVAKSLLIHLTSSSDLITFKLYLEQFNPFRLLLLVILFPSSPKLADLRKMREVGGIFPCTIGDFYFLQAHFVLFVMRELLVEANMVRVQGNKI